jgi:hypothetical protein
MREEPDSNRQRNADLLSASADLLQYLDNLQAEYDLTKAEEGWVISSAMHEISKQQIQAER